MFIPAPQEAQFEQLASQYAPS